MKIQKVYKKWEKIILAKALKKMPERKEFETSWGKKQKVVNLPEEFDYLNESGFPGKFPYTRGVQPTMYRARFWTMRQYAGFGTSQETNKRFKYLLKNGQNGLSVAFDLPTQIGLDSDDPQAKGEVGKVGVAVDSLQDFEEIFEDINLGNISTSMTINSTAIILLAMYIALAEKQNIPLEKLSGTVQNDILKEYISRGTYIFPVKESLRLSTDIIEYCSNNLPKFNSISISGYHIREARANALQELAYTIANGITYVQSALNRGLKIDKFAPRISFFFSVNMRFLEEVAKFRAARKIWAEIMKDRFKAKNPKSMKLRFHTQTAGSSLITQQPLNNITRTTIEALAAVLGGTQSLHTNSYDEALSIPTKEAVDIALKTQQIIAHETDATHNVDPLGGSYLIETLTKSLVKNTYKELENLEKRGGVIKSIRNGYIKREIEKTAYEYYKNMNRKKEIVVGKNKFVNNRSKKSNYKIEQHNSRKKQIKKLKQLKNKRDNEQVKKTLKKLYMQAKNQNSNLLEPIIDCVKTYCTIGEITSELKRVFGIYKDNYSIKIK